jgi:hypothetical protein
MEINHMTNLEALRMVRSASKHLDTFGKKANKAWEAAARDMEYAERGLEFETFFELGGKVVRTW